MRKNIHDNIAVKQAKTAIIAAVIVGFLFSFAQLAYDLVQEHQGTQQNIAHILNSMKDPATKAAYNLSSDLAENVLTGIFENPQIKEGYVYATFGTGENELLAQRQRTIAASNIQWFADLIFDEERLYTLNLQLPNDGSVAGLLQLRLDGQFLAQNFIDRAIVVFLAGFLRNILLTFVLIFAFYNTLTKPISKIAKKIENINVDRPELSLLEIPKSHENDELGTLVRGINTSLSLLGSNLQRRRLAEAEKEESMKVFQALAKTSSDIFWKTDKTAQISIISNDKNSQEIEASLNLNGSNLFEVMMRNCSADINETVQILKKSPRDFRDIQLRFILNDSLLILSFFGSASFDENGEFEGYLGTAANITKTVLQTLEISEAKDKLRQAQKMEAVGQLTGGIAHDFNNLLAIIIGNLELIEEKIENQPEIQKMLSAAITSGEKGAVLTQQLLSFSRKQALNPCHVDLNSLLHDLTGMLERTLGREISVKTDFEEGLVKGFIDPTQFENAIINLSINARDAMPSGGTLSIKTENFLLDEEMEAISGVMQPGVFVRITISDTGFGMDKLTLQKAMEPFFTTKEVGKGSGMGLAMVFGFIAQSSGHIQIESELDLGTNIYIYLPCEKIDPLSVDRRKVIISTEFEAITKRQ